ncbi:MAG: tetratricopeptide repeat protein [Acidobacteria bacterium]|nr:tetratricopeptide repeat protein [Acidobacteriota bacterium]
MPGSAHLVHILGGREIKWRVPQVVSLIGIVVLALGYTVYGSDDSKHKNESKTEKENYNLPFGPNPFAPGEVQTSTGTFISADKFIPASYCARCHSSAHAQWAESPHRSSFRGPFYQKNIDDFIKQYGIETTRHCESCHNPIALVSGALTTGSKIPRPFDDEGVTCTVCHSIEKITYLEGTGSYRIAPPALLVDENGKPFPGKVTDRMILANKSAHKRAMMKDFYKTPEFCAVCHKAALPRQIENYKWRRSFSVYDEWQMSSHSNESPLPFYKRSRSTCQSCHMGPETARGDLAAKHGMIASHRWPASNTALPYLYGYKDQLQRVTEFLDADHLGIDIFTLKKGVAYPTQREGTDLITLRKGAAGLKVGEGFATINSINAALYPGHQKPDDTIIAPINKSTFSLAPGETVTLGVVISNRGVGHLFPTELRDFFEPWVEFKVQDVSGGRIVYHSGFLKPDGTVDERSHKFQSVQVTEKAQAVRHHNIWETRGRAYDNFIAPGRSELVRYQFTIPKTASGPLRVSARVLYRKFNRFFSNYALGKSVDLPIVEMGQQTITLNLGENRPATSKLDGRDLIRFNNLGIALFDQFMYADAKKAFEKVTQIGPTYDDGYINQALASFWRENFPEIHQLLDKALAINPNNLRATYYKGALLRLENKPAEALKLFRQVESRYPRDRMVLNQMGKCYQDLGMQAEACQMFERVLTIDPDDTIALYFVIEGYRQTGNAKLAAETNVTYLDKFEDWRIHYLANEYIKKDPDALAEAVPWHIHSDVNIPAAQNADPIYWSSEGVPKRKQ